MTHLLGIVDSWADGTPKACWLTHFPDGPARTVVVGVTPHR
jgi:hypothetical protein